MLLSCILANSGFPYDSRSDLRALHTTVLEASLESLEDRRDTIVNTLDKLARFSLNSGVGRIGFRSGTHLTSDATEWIQIDFGEVMTLDKIVLVPTIWRDAELGFVAEAFPLVFDISIGLDNGDVTTIATFDDSDSSLPRVAPFIIDLEPVRAKWMRLTATKLTKRNFDGLHLLQFSEILVFNDHKNIALRSDVTTSSASSGGIGAWSENFLVDGYLPYLMDSSEGEGSLSYVNDLEFSGLLQEKPSYDLDLGAVQEVDHIMLHVVEQTDTVPQAFSGDYGVPFELLIEGARERDFSDAAILAVFERNAAIDIGPIICLDLLARECRYIRMTALKPYMFHGFSDDGTPVDGPRFGFAEVEVFSDGKNVALGKTFRGDFNLPPSPRKIEALTDGNNLYGQILGMREWLDQLAERHDLLVELPLVNQELDKRYARQKLFLQSALLAIGGFIIAVIMLVLVTRTRHQRAIYHTRERITADLHDVLGGNISAMVLLSELANTQRNDSEKLDGYLGRIETLAVRTRNALKYVSNMLNQTGLYENLFAEVRRVAKGLTEGLEHELKLSGEQYVTRIDQRSRVDIFLFYKECLVNVIRHAHATRIFTRLEIDQQMVRVEVCDNGIGFSDMNKSKVPGSLYRRARILGAQVSVSSPERGGCCIRMEYNWNRSWPKRLLDKTIPPKV